MIFPITVTALDKHKTVRVGWFPYSGYQEYDKKGRPWGYNYEYLTEIAKYTGWEYEFIEGTWDECFAMLQKGEIDIFGCLYRMPEREKILDYTGIDCGEVSISLFVPKASPLEKFEFDSFNGIKVGACLTTNNDEELLKYAEENGFTCEIIGYDTQPELIDAVLNGKVDAGVAGSYLSTNDTRVIASFSPDSFYFATTKGNHEIIVGLNRALNAIKTAAPYYDRDLAAKYDQATKPDLISQVNRLPTYIVLIFAILLFLVILGLAKVLNNRAKSLRTIQRLLYHDTLTKLYNKYGFEKRANELLRTTSGEKFCAIVALDIDSFAVYNESNGVKSGDAILRAVATSTKECLNFKEEIAARFSADNFALFMAAADMEELKARILHGHACFRALTNNQTLRITYGVYKITDRTMPISAMYDRAVSAMRTAKNNVECSIAEYNQEMFDCQIEDVNLIMSAERAFQNGEFVAYYQPKYDVMENIVVGGEALVRWIEPDGTIVPPERFIYLFEQNGLISRLDFFMMEEVCRALKKLLDQGEVYVPISLNFSRAHLFDPNFPNKLLEITKKYGVPACLLEIELTESSFLIDFKMMKEVINQLHDQGFKVSVDDFGSGYSSLGILKDIPADILKIDMRFMEDFEKGGRVGTVMTAVTRMARWLNIPVVVEGVETKQQAEFLKSIGCNVSQGYFYSKPLPGDQWEARLKQQTGFKTQQRENFHSEELDILLGGNRVLNRLLSGLCSGFALYEFIDGKLEIIRVNDGYYRIMRADICSIKEYSADIIQKIAEDDREKLIERVYEAIETDEPVSVTIKRYRDDGHLINVEGTILRISGDDEHPILCITFNDVTDNQ